jgi:hypothetical protein
MSTCTNVDIDREQVLISRLHVTDSLHGNNRTNLSNKITEYEQRLDDIQRIRLKSFIDVQYTYEHLEVGHRSFNRLE